MNLLLTSVQFFFIIIIIFGFAGLLRGWRRELVSMGFILVTVLFLFVGGAGGGLEGRVAIDVVVAVAGEAGERGEGAQDVDTVEADHQAIAHELVGAHALDLRHVLDALGLRLRHGEEREQSRETCLD